MDTNAKAYWEGRKKLGRPKLIETPEELWGYACEYFNRVNGTPFKKQDFIRGGEYAGSKVNLDQMAPYTWEGLEAYLFEKVGIAHIEDYRYNKDGRYEKFTGIIHAIGKIIYDRNFSGAAVGAFSHNLIARQLGLTEKTEMKVTEQPLFGDPDEDDISELL